MANAKVTTLRPSTDPVREARGAYVHDSLTDERWTVRQVALRMGISPTALGDRMKGRVSFLAEDIEEIAGILKRDPVEFYAAYLAAGHNPSPDESDPRDKKWYLQLATVTPIRRHTA